jgi:DNA repair protein RadA
MATLQSENKMDMSEESKQKCPHCHRAFANVDKHLSSCKAFAAKQTQEGVIDETTDKEMASKIADEMTGKVADESGSDGDEVGLDEEDEPEVGSKPPAPEKKKSIVLVDDLPYSQIKSTSGQALGPKNAQKIIAWLKGNSYFTVHQLANAKIKDISIKGFKEDRIAQLIQLSRDALGIYYMRPASEIPMDYEIVKFNIPMFDDLIGGGFRTGDSYEFAGHFGALKTQIAAFTDVRLQFDKSHGGLHDPKAEKRPQCLWVDSEGTMAGMITPRPDGTPGRLQQVAAAQFKKEYPQPPESDEAAVAIWKQQQADFIQAVMKNTLICRVLSSEHQMTVVKNILAIVWQYNIKLVVVDSLIAHFRAEYIGRGTLSNRQQLLNQHINDLMHLKGTTAILIVTNQVQAKPDSFAAYPGADPNEPTGGNIVKHAFNNRVKCRKGKKGSVKLELIDSSYLPYSTANIIASSQGIEGFVGDKVTSDDELDEEE